MGLSREARIRTLLVIDTVFFFVELIVGYATHSLALIADSFHMLNDVASLIVALYAIKLASQRTASSKYTYGWQRAEILGALINGVFLLALCFSIFMEAVERFFNPAEVGNPQLVVIVGAFGLLSNIIGLFLFHDHGHSHGGHSHGHSHGASSHSHSKAKSTTNGDLESGDGHRHGPHAADHTHPHKHSSPSHSHPHSPTERSPLLTAPSTSSRSDRLPPYESTSAAHKIDSAGDSEEDERMDELLYAHPAQTRANLLRAAQEGFHGGARKRGGSLSAQGDSSALGRRKSETTAVGVAGTAVGQAEHSGHGHAHGDGHGHEHDHDHDESDGHGHGGHSHESMNMRGVFLHVLGDALGNVGVIAAGLIIWLTTSPYRFYSDPLISLIITIIIFSSALPLVRSACSILLQGVPAQISLETVRSAILAVRGVVSLHELHVWSLSESTFVASVHIVVEGSEYPRVAAEIREALHQCSIHSTTIQPEFVNERGEMVITRPSSPKGSQLAAGSGAGTGEEAETVSLGKVPDNGCLVKCVEESCRGSTCCPPPGAVPGQES